MPKIALLCLSVLCLGALRAQDDRLVSDRPATGGFALHDATLVYDEGDVPLVKKVAELFAGDLESVTGRKPALATQIPSGDVVILGTVEKSALIARLVADGKLDVADIKGGWERFKIVRLPNLRPASGDTLVIVGSDRRGLAYGAFTLSEAIGVSAWSWWADVPVRRQPGLYVVADRVSKSPSVKYRGIFINDEDWGLQPWAAKTFETDVRDIGPKTNARVCELLLRLKANMLAPAMHACTAAFYSRPGNKLAADEYGILVTTSHCEPLLFNNAAASEWTKSRDGEWNYATNRETILTKLDDRVKEAAPFENIYTVGMRGLHDEGMIGDYSNEKKVSLLAQAIADQRDILKKHLRLPLPEIPQIFVPYKEALDLYNLGLKVPDDVTLVWTDDNYGYIKRLGNAEERARPGGSGVYYHTSYLGAPHDYLWLNTTPPGLMYAELRKAFENGADRYWLLNVGDIKPCELGMQTFFDFAWDVDAFDFRTINRHQSDFVARHFGERCRAVTQRLLDGYYRLAWSRKPEMMGWERQWDDRRLANIHDTDFSFENHNDAQQRLADYAELATLADQVLQDLPEDARPAYFQLVAYPVKGSCQMNRKMLLAQLSRALAKQGDFAGANWAGEQAVDACNQIEQLNQDYGSMLDGKWKHMMALAPGWVAQYQKMPEVGGKPGAGSRPVDIAPSPARSKPDRYAVIDLARPAKIVAPKDHTVRVIEGIGYDWTSVQLGLGNETRVDPSNLSGARVEYEFAAPEAEKIVVHVYSVPFFPLHPGRSTEYGISVDNQKPVVSRNERAEFSRAWKDQVLQNGFLTKAEFTVKKSSGKHTLALTVGDPGMIVQRVIVDWGGLKPTYVGPGPNRAE